MIEFGRASGIGSPKGDVTDEEYFKATRHLFGKAELGMFCRPDFFGDEQFRQVSEYRPDFLRVGTNASKVEPSEKTISRIRETGAKVRYSLIQAHAVTPKVLADNAKKVEGYGAQTITIMDSTGNMMPSRVKEYVSALVDALSVPVGFHCHDNLGLSIANALAAVEAGRHFPGRRHLRPGPQRGQRGNRGTLRGCWKSGAWRPVSTSTNYCST